MALGIPLELATLAGSSILSGVMTLWGQSQKSKQQAHESAIEALKVKAGVIDQARRYSNSGFQFTRRIIALTAVGAIIVLPKLVPLVFPEVDLTVGYTSWSPGFLFFEGSESVKWETFKGLVLTPLDTHLMTAIIGLYFGASITRNAR